MAKINFTAPKIAAFRCPPGKAQAFLWDAAAPGLGLRATPKGQPAFVFQAEMQGKGVRITIGSPDAWNLPQAREKARELQRLIDEGKDPREQKREAIAQARQAEKQAQAKLEAAKYTLGALLLDYCDFQRERGRAAHKDARSIFTLHVIEAWPKLANLPANEVTGEQIADTMRRLVELGKGRTANKLRSYVRAAYEVARTARSKPTTPVRFKAYAIQTNPAGDTAPDETANTPAKHPLSLEELRMYWQTIKTMPGTRGAVLRLHLLTGGQRIVQLVRLKTIDVSRDSIRLYDGKGRPGAAPRPHEVPLLEPARLALAEIAAPAGEWAISTDGGRTHLAPTTLSEWAKEAPHGIAGFHAKRLRSGIETALAAARVSREDRGRLQSHGIGGVQSRHYDAHDYMPEKLRALETLLRLLESPAEGLVLHFDAQAQPQRLRVVG